MSERLNHNPDVLSCLANLSNDEVLTPPEVANAMLDMLPQKLFRDPNARFLDPACKSGIFLREIAKRLLDGLKDSIPDRQERIDHIFHKQLYGIAITELTSLLARRSLYCSKHASSVYSVTPFEVAEGNIRFKRIEHSWDSNGKCQYCGASKEQFDRGVELETHAYEFIHIKSVKELNDMKFDLIISNPPYQLSDGGAQQSASPIYNFFIDNAKKLKPRFLIMIVPARWYSGGKGLDEFRAKMLSDDRIRVIHDFPETKDCFPGVNIRGGVCYFLWDRDNKGLCKVYNHRGDIVNFIERPLLENNADTFIRYNLAVNVLHKVQKFSEPVMSELVSSRKPFGFATNFSDFQQKIDKDANILMYRFGENGYVKESQISKGKELIDRIKIFIPYASPGTDDYPHLILSKPIIALKRTVCTETYLVVGPFASKNEALNVAEYMRTKFFRFMVLLLKSAQHVTQKVYALVPQQDFTKLWTDDKLYKKYNITKEEQQFIDSLIKDVAWGDLAPVGVKDE